jgi:putative SOS response-associated peptidase YedK
MCGRFDTSHLTWREIHDRLASLVPVKTAPLNLEGSVAGEVTGFTIMTGTSAGWLADYHDRAPVILEPDEWSAWLDPKQDAGELMAAVRPERLEIRAAA